MRIIGHAEPNEKKRVYGSIIIHQESAPMETPHMNLEHTLARDLIKDFEADILATLIDHSPYAMDHC